jgi:hypothetical protein
MNSLAGKDEPGFREAVRRLQRGDFDALAPLFGTGTDPASDQPQVIEWHQAGLFSDEPQALAEALSCACFLGRTSVAEYLLDQGVDPTAGAGTGMDAFHWAVDLPPFYGPGAVRVGSTVTDGSSGRRSAAESARGTIAPYSAGVRYPNEL